MIDKVDVGAGCDSQTVLSAGGENVITGLLGYASSHYIRVSTRELKGGVQTYAAMDAPCPRTQTRGLAPSESRGSSNDTQRRLALRSSRI